MPVPGSPSVKLDMDLAWALSKRLSYSQFIRVELSFGDRAHRYIGYVRVLRGGERSICVDDPVDDHLLKRGFIKPLD
ncbi:hypothetical protein CEP52_017845, partial [Fusarium oligoseptatum]